jgi:nitrate reductase beta subunit
MFGPAVGDAIDTYRQSADDPDLSGLLSLFGSTQNVVPRWKRSGDVVIGLEEDGREIVRVPVREPVHVRQALDAERGVVRTNCP